MNFDWLVSLSAALFASVIGVPGEPDRSIPAPISGENVPVKELIDNSGVATEADFINKFGGILYGKFVPRENLLDMSEKILTKEFVVNALLFNVEEELPKDFVYPPLKEAIGFRDISGENPIFEPAQKLKSLGILSENNGFFGKPNEQNPEMSISEMNQIISKTFDEKGALNFLTDQDLDGVPNSLDACPDIPAKNGCPVEIENNKFPNDTVIKVSDKVNVVEQKEIQMGDTFSAVIFDPITGEIFVESNKLTVTK